MPIKILLACRFNDVNQRDLAKLLVGHERLDVEFVVDDPNHPEIDSLEESQIHYTPLSSRSIRFVLSRYNPLDKRRFMAVVNEVEPDILLTTGITPLRFFPSTTRFSPSVFLPQGGETELAFGHRNLNKNLIMRRFYRTIYRRLLGELLKHVDEVWTAATNKSDLVEIGMPPEKLRDFDWSYVDTNIFEYQDDHIEFSEELTVGTFRRMQASTSLLEGYKTLLEAVHKTVRQGTNLHLVLGGYPEDANKTSSFVDKKIEELSLESNVTRVKLVPKSELPTFYSGLDVYVNVPHTGIAGGSGIGTASKEAMACQCAFVGMSEDGTSHKSGLIDGQDGIITPLDSKNVNSVLVKLSNSPNYRERLGSNARKFIKEEFSQDVIGGKIFNYCNNIISQKSEYTQ